MGQIREILEKTLCELNQIEECKKREDYSRTIKRYNSLIKSLNQCIKELVQDVIVLSDYTLETEGYFVEKNIEVNMSHSQISIKLNELLPHRPHYDINTHQMICEYDIAQWKRSYHKAFEKELSKYKIKTAQQKVQMTFIHHIKESRVDLDNFDTKAIIDLVTLFFLQDDSKSHVCYYIDSVEDEKEYTEIILTLPK